MFFTQHCAPTLPGSSVFSFCLWLLTSRPALSRKKKKKKILLTLHSWLISFPLPSLTTLPPSGSMTHLTDVTTHPQSPSRGRCCDGEHGGGAICMWLWDGWLDGWASERGRGESVGLNYSSTLYRMSKGRGRRWKQTHPVLCYPSRVLFPGSLSALPEWWRTRLWTLMMSLHLLLFKKKKKISCLFFLTNNVFELSREWSTSHVQRLLTHLV